MFFLRDVVGWQPGTSCVPTALAAISGKSLSEIGGLLSDAAGKKGRQISSDLRDDYDINDWIAVIQSLGGECIQGESYADREFDERPSINEWMFQKMGPDLELVFCDNGADIGHVFGTINNQVVDTYTLGKRVPFTQVPPEFELLRIKRVFLV